MGGGGIYTYRAIYSRRLKPTQWRVASQRKAREGKNCCGLLGHAHCRLGRFRKVRGHGENERLDKRYFSVLRMSNRYDQTCTTLLRHRRAGSPLMVLFYHSFPPQQKVTRVAVPLYKGKKGGEGAVSYIITLRCKVTRRPRLYAGLLLSDCIGPRLTARIF